MTHSATPQPASEAKRVQPVRLLLTLGGAGVLAGGLIVFVYQATQPAIQAHKAQVLSAAIEEVLESPARYDTLYVVSGALTRTAPAGPMASDERLYLGYDASGNPVGYAIPAEQPGFQDIVRLLFGYDAARDRLLGMKILEDKETPGLGAKIETDSAFIAGFAGVATPIVGVKAGGGTARDSQSVDMITGATISSRTVIRAINQALERYKPMIRAYHPESAR